MLFRSKPKKGPARLWGIQIGFFDFQEELASLTDLYSDVRFETLTAFLNAMAKLAKNRLLVIVFDEFQNFRYIDASVFSTFQKWIDANQDRKGLTSKNSSYRLYDPFTRFWFRYLFKYSRYIEIEAYDHLMKIIETDLRRLCGKRR